MDTEKSTEFIEGSEVPPQDAVLEKEAVSKLEAPEESAASEEPPAAMNGVDTKLTKSIQTEELMVKEDAALPVESAKPEVEESLPKEESDVVAEQGESSGNVPEPVEAVDSEPEVNQPVAENVLEDSPVEMLQAEAPVPELDDSPNFVPEAEQTPADTQGPDQEEAVEAVAELKATGDAEVEELPKEELAETEETLLEAAEAAPTEAQESNEDAAEVMEEPVVAAAEEAVTEQAAVEEAVAEEPIVAAVEEAVAEEPIVAAVMEEAAAEEPVVAVEEEAVVEEPVVAAEEEAVAEEPVVATEEEAIAEEPVVATEEEAIAEEPVVATEEEAIAEEPVVAAEEEAIAEEPVVAAEEEAVAEEPVVAAEEEAVAGEPVVATEEEAVAEEPVVAAEEEEEAVAEEPVVATEEEAVAEEPVVATEEQVASEGAEVVAAVEVAMEEAMVAATEDVVMEEAVAAVTEEAIVATTVEAVMEEAVVAATEEAAVEEAVVVATEEAAAEEAEKPVVTEEVKPTEEEKEAQPADEGANDAEPAKEEDPAPAPGSLSFALLEQEQTRDTLRTSRTLVVLRGLPGSGKSFLARAIAEAYKDHCSVICADDYEIKPENTEASSDGYKALDEAVVASCNTSTALIVVDDTNHSQDRLARLGEIAEEHHLIMIFLEPRTEWCGDVAQLKEKTKRELEEGKLEAMKTQYEEMSLPLFFGWFLLPSVQEKVRCSSMDFLKTLDTLEAFKKHTSDFTGKAEKEVDLEQYFKSKGNLHCTTKFCNYGKAEGAKEYAQNPAVNEFYGSSFELSLSAFFVTPRTVGARVSLTEEQLALWPADPEKEAESSAPAAVSPPLGSRAHVTLGCAEDVEPVQTGLDLLEILALQEGGQQGELAEEMELGTLTYYGEGRWLLSLREPICAPAVFSSFYSSKHAGKKEPEKKKKKCTIL